MKKMNSNSQKSQTSFRKSRKVAYIGLPIVLSACSMFSQPQLASPSAPAKWFNFNVGSSSAKLNKMNLENAAPTLIAHQGSLTNLQQWWSSLKDPVLLELITEAQKLSPSVAIAKTRIEQARAQQTLSQAAAIPNLAGSLGLSRARTDPTLPVANMLSGSLQASWEIDLWGSLSLGKNAANKRLQGSQASWHEARVSVAAEVASVYYSVINCERLANSSLMQVQSFKESQKLNDLLVKNGFMSQTQSSYAVLALSQSENNLAQINAQCRSLKNALFALTGLSEEKLASISANPSSSRFPSSVMMPVLPQVPAELLAQRPDVWAAENEVAAVSAELGQANRQYLPRLGLSGSVTAIRANSSDLTTNLKTWSVGPLAFTMPIFEGGKIAAQQQIANAQYDQAVVVYQAKVRQAVQETQDALSQLQATDEQAQSALAGFKAASQILKSSELQSKQGMISGLQLEDAKRQMLSSKMLLQNAELNRMNAWIGLYRVLGGGWNSNINGTSTS